jgi:hypothetical protein
MGEKKMRKLNVGIVAVFVAFAMAGSLFAQEQQEQTRSQVEVTRAEIQADRQAIVASNLKLTEAQAKAFWPLYRQYRTEMQTVNDQLVNLVQEYGQQYETLNDQQAADLMKRYLKYQKEVTAVKEKYAPRFASILPQTTVLRFYQIENKMDTIVMLSVAAQIPLAK